MTGDPDLDLSRLKATWERLVEIRKAIGQLEYEQEKLVDELPPGLTEFEVAEIVNEEDPAAAQAMLRRFVTR